MQNEIAKTDLVDINENIEINSKYRITSIRKKARLHYKKALNDFKVKISQIEISRKDLMDLRSKDGTGIIKTNEFQGEKFVLDDINYTMNLKGLKETLEESEKRYKSLFQGE